MWNFLFNGKNAERKSCKLNVPNGWGRQNYSTPMRFLKNFRADKSRPSELKSMSFIQKFMVQHITGFNHANFKSYNYEGI